MRMVWLREKKITVIDSGAWFYLMGTAETQEAYL